MAHRRRTCLGRRPRHRCARGRRCRCTAGARILVVRVRLPGAGSGESQVASPHGARQMAVRARRNASYPRDAPTSLRGVWGDDPKLVELLGERGAAGFRSLFDGFPDLVGVLWAIRDGNGRVVDFTFGYGNPSMLSAFRIPPEQA